MKTLLTVTALSISLCQSMVASEEPFNLAYSDYNDAIVARDWERSLTAAERALTEGLAIFDVGGENVANLRLNYANELIRSESFKPAAELLVDSLRAKTRNLGSESQDLIEVLMPLAKSTATFSVRRATPYFRQALELAEDNPALSARLRLDAGLSLFKAGEREQSLEFLTHAQNYYAQRFGLTDFRSGIAGINLGRIYYEAQDYDQAEAALDKARPAFRARTDASERFAAAITDLAAVIKTSRDIEDRPSMDPSVGVSLEHLGPRSGDH